MGISPFLILGSMFMPVRQTQTFFFSLSSVWAHKHAVRQRFRSILHGLFPQGDNNLTLPTSFLQRNRKCFALASSARGNAVKPVVSVTLNNLVMSRVWRRTMTIEGTSPSICAVATASTFNQPWTNLRLLSLCHTNGVQSENRGEGRGRWRLRCSCETNWTQPMSNRDYKKIHCQWKGTRSHTACELFTPSFVVPLFSHSHYSHFLSSGHYRMFFFFPFSTGREDTISIKVPHIKSQLVLRALQAEGHPFSIKAYDD